MESANNGRPGTNGRRPEPALPAFGLAEDLAGSERPSVRGERTSALKVVTFSLAGENYGLPVVEVREINRVTDVTRVPKAASHVVGVVNLRGEIIPLVDLALLLGVGVATRSDKSRIVVAEVGPRRVGLLVDAVHRCEDLRAEEIEREVQELEIDRTYVTGIARSAGRMTILIDLNRVFVEN